jgi:hypothetical protein
MKPALTIFVAMTLAIAACGGSGGDCKNLACSIGSTRTYQLCGTLDTSTTYKFDGMSCSCAAAESAACTSCASKVAAYCNGSLTDGGGDFAGLPDLATDNSTCSVVGSFGGTTTGGNTVKLTSTGTSTSGSFTLSITGGTTTTYITGNYSYATGSLTMTNASSSATPSCVGMAEKLTIAWTNSCETMMLTKASDACTGRTLDLSGDTLTRTLPDMSI